MVSFCWKIDFFKWGSEMANLKISEMLHAIGFSSYDRIPMINALLENYSVDREAFLQALPGEAVQMSGLSSRIVINGDGGSAVELLNGDTFDIHSAKTSIYTNSTTGGEYVSTEIQTGAYWELVHQSGTRLTLDINGNVVFQGGFANGFTMVWNGASIQIDDGGLLSLGSNPGLSTIIAYEAGNSADWAGAAPTDLAVAIDRLASAFNSHFGPVP